MNSKRSFLIIILSCLLTVFTCQVSATDKRTSKPETVSRVPAKVEPTRAQPKDPSVRTPAKLQPVKKSPAQVSQHGFCCKDGETSKSTAKTCKKERGAFYRSEREAAKSCLGYCCADFAVSQTTKEKCKSVRGKYYSDKQQADRFCESQKGFCCIEGQTSQLTKRKCKTKRGEFYSSKKRAAKECRPEAGFCNHKGKTFRLTQEQCDKKKGNYFTSQILAKKAVVKLRQQELHEKRSVTKLSPVNQTAVYCCLKGRVKEVSPGECKMKKGKPYRTENEARKNCGWCCAENKVFSTTPDSCKRKGGNYFVSKIQADQQCKEQAKCCVAGNLFTYSQLECKRKNGTYYHFYREAKKQCRVAVGNARSKVSPSQETEKVPTAQGQPGALSPLPAELKPVNQGQKDGVMYNSTRSITVISPAQGDFLAQGDQVDIIWNVEGDLETDCMSISLQSNSLHVYTGPAIINAQYHDTRQGTSTHYQQRYTWNIPTTPNLQGAAYLVRVETCDGAVAGDSGSFLFPGMNPEYSVSNIHISPPSPYVGDTITIMADIANMGGLNSTGYRSFTLDYNVYEGAYGNLQTTDSGLLQAPPLGFGGRYQVTLPYTLNQEGPHSVYFHVLPYPGGQSMDPFLGNNYGWFEFTVGPEQLPDLVVCMKKRNRVDPPGSFTFPARVENIGNTISTPAKLSFFVTGNGIRHYDVPALTPGQISVPQRTLYWTSDGYNHFEVHIDYNEQVEELSNDNNELVGVIVRGKYGDRSEIICSDHPDAKIPVP